MVVTRTSAQIRSHAQKYFQKMAKVKGTSSSSSQNTIGEDAFAVLEYFEFIQDRLRLCMEEGGGRRRRCSGPRVEDLLGAAVTDDSNSSGSSTMTTELLVASPDSYSSHARAVHGREAAEHQREQEERRKRQRGINKVLERGGSLPAFAVDPADICSVGTGTGSGGEVGVSCSGGDDDGDGDGDGIPELEDTALRALCSSGVSGERDGGL